METRAHYVAVGAFVLTMVALAFASVLWLARAELSTRYSRYDIYFEGPVTGLRDGAAVEYNGVPVGKVVDVRIDPVDVEKIRVTAEIDNNVPIKTDARASVESNLLSGVAYIQIVRGTQKAPLLEAKAGQRYPVIKAHRSRLADVTRRAPELLGKLNDTAERLNSVLDDKNREALAETLGNLRDFSAALAARKQDVALLTGNANQAAVALTALIGHVDKSYSGHDGLASKLGGAIGDFDRVAKNLDSTSRQLQLAVKDVRPGLKDFSQQTLGNIASLVAETRQLVAGLSQLTAEISRDPSRVLFGDRRVGYSPR
jgi:phospholipid/cholesterol/gamma-HCH transport system substrate-binding protein